MPRAYSSKQKLKSSGTTNKNVRVSVLCGGTSSERAVSLRSGRAVLAGLKRAGFNARSLDPKHWSRIQKPLRESDVIFLALHGTGGEDGVMQRKLEQLGVPYIGSGAKASFTAFDKVLSKKVFEKKGIPTPRGVVVPSPNWKRKLSKLTFPLFAKPVAEGSSVGVFEIEDLAQNAEKLRKSVKRFGRLLVEEKIRGREFTVGILGAKALPVIELCPKRSFYDYRAKYTKGMTVYKVPARIPKALAAKLQRTGLAVHKALGLRDFSRIDMMVDEKGNPFVLEANSIPGFTELSLLPKAARAGGISFEDLCARLVEFAVRRKGK